MKVFRKFTQYSESTLTSQGQDLSKFYKGQEGVTSYTMTMKDDCESAPWQMLTAANCERLSGNADDGCCRDRSSVVFMEPCNEVDGEQEGEEEESVQEKRKGAGSGEDVLRSQLPELVCVEYPGIVSNPVKMIETLGGLETLAQVLLRLRKKLGHELF